MNDKLTKEEAKKIILFDKNMCHVFNNLPCGLIGGDHSKKSVFKDIDNSFECRITGEQAMKMGHGLAIIPSKECNQSEILFVETKKSFNEKKSKKGERK